MFALEAARTLLKRNLASFYQHHAREALVARQVAYLNSFEDRLLSDLGLSRADLEAHVRRRLGQKV